MNPSPTEYHVENLSGTSGSNVGWMLLAAGLVFASHAQPQGSAPVLPFVTIAVSPGTVGQFGNMFAAALPQPKGADFERTVADFYSTLLASQEPLGKEFEKVLHENLWDLYVRS
jgi:hypothetical protein